MHVKKQQLEPDLEQQTGSKSGKEYIKAVYCHPAYLMSMQSTSCEMSGWIKHKLESRLPRKISTSGSLTTLKPLTVDHNKLWKILKEMRIPDHLTWFLRYLYADQRATEPDMVKMDRFQIGK